MIKRHGIVIIISCLLLALIVCFGVCAAEVEDDEEISLSENSIDTDLFFASVTGSLETITEQLDENNELNKQIIESQNKQGDENKGKLSAINDNLINLDNNRKVVIQSEQKEESSGEAAEESTTEAPAEESTTEALPEEGDTSVVDLLGQIHTDILVLIVSLWTISGLSIGLKALTRMFGYG